MQHSITTQAFREAPPNQRVEFVGFLCPMPYRLRIGANHAGTVSIHTSTVRLWFRNRIEIPEGTPFHESFKGRLTAEMFTDAVALVETQAEGDMKDVSQCLQALNYFVIGYAEASRAMFGVGPLRRLNISDVLMSNGRTVRVQAARTEAWDPVVAELLALPTFRHLTMLDGATGHMDDLPAATLSAVPLWIERCQDHLFHEFGFEAKAKMVGQDPTGALLMAVAALEGAHSAFVQERLAERLPADKAGKLTDDFLRELGMTLSNQLTPYLFMEPKERPASELITNAGTAMKLRNEILHALKAKDGRYRHRLRSNRELSEAYSAALKLYWHYRDAYYALLEARAATSPEADPPRAS